MACAVAGAWRVYADLKSVEASGKGNATGCVGFEGLGVYLIESVEWRLGG